MMTVPQGQITQRIRWIIEHKRERQIINMRKANTLVLSQVAYTLLKHELGTDLKHEILIEYEGMKVVVLDNHEEVIVMVG